MSESGTKIFVYGVSRSCPRDILESEFGKIGKVVDVFNTGKGFAFITMEDERDAKIACEDLNGSSIDGQEVKVEIAHGRGSSRGGGGRDRGGYRGDRRDRGGYGDRDRDRGYGGGRDRYRSGDDRGYDRRDRDRSPRRRDY